MRQLWGIALLGCSYDGLYIVSALRYMDECDERDLRTYRLYHCVDG